MKRWIKIALWSFFGITVIVLLFIIGNIQRQRVLEEPEIIVEKTGENPFLNSKELLAKLKIQGLFFDGMLKEQLNSDSIEAYIAGISQVKSVKVFTEIGTHWKIEVKLRDPVARIYNKYGESFYLDTDGEIMSTTATHTARCVVVNGEVYDRINSISVNEIINNDSLKSIRKLDDIYRISNYVCYDPLFRSLIGQIYLEKNGDFVLVPLVGDQKIVFGTAVSEEEVGMKFKKLRIFYNEAMPNVGWETYSEISLKYDGQIVCKTKPTTN